MIHKKLHKLLLALATGLVLVLGVGAGHSLLMQQTMPHDSMKMSHNNPCQSVCAPMVNGKQQQPQIEEEDNDPYPAFAILKNQLVLTNFAYSLAFAVLFWAYLKRRPPDLILEYGKFRN